MDKRHDDGTFDVKWDYPDGGPAFSRVSKEDIQRYIPPRRVKDLPIGSAHQGTVVDVRPFGIFVDIGATHDGLVHISCIRDGFVENIEEEIQLGQEVAATWCL